MCENANEKEDAINKKRNIEVRPIKTEKPRIYGPFSFQFPQEMKNRPTFPMHPLEPDRLRDYYQILLFLLKKPIEYTYTYTLHRIHRKRRYKIQKTLMQTHHH